MEIRMHEVILAGRMTKEPMTLPDGTTHFLFEADQNQAPFHCFCEGVAAQNLLKYCQQGDEFSVEGKLEWRKFANENRPLLLIRVRYISYGRKLKTLRG